MSRIAEGFFYICAGVAMLLLCGAAFALVIMTMQADLGCP